MQKPKISVIMGVYNQWNVTALKNAVRSILDQTWEDFEFIIFDDGSHPDAAKYIKGLADLDSRIRIIGGTENRGLAHSLNECIRYANGIYIARMDADDISLPMRLEKQYHFLEEHPSYAWCGCNTKLFDSHGIWGMRIMPEMPQREDYLKYSPYVHPSVMYRREIFDKESGYLESEETLRCEDYEIFMRFAEKGLKGYNLQETLFCYREEFASYRKRTLHFRCNVAKIRYRNFKKMGLLFPFGWLYVIRPIIGSLLPASVIAFVKKREAAADQKKSEEYEHEPAVRTVSQYTFPKSTT